jgi:hypothetical protein
MSDHVCSDGEDSALDDLMRRNRLLIATARHTCADTRWLLSCVAAGVMRREVSQRLDQIIEDFRRRRRLVGREGTE